MRIIVFWGLYWGPSIVGNYHTYAESNRDRWGLLGLCLWPRGRTSNRAGG